MEISQLKDNNLKKEITNTIFRDLPDWFEVEEGIVKYVNTQYDKTFYVAKIYGDYAGFFSLAFPFPNVCNLYVLGVKQKYGMKKILS